MGEVKTRWVAIAGVFPVLVGEVFPLCIIDVHQLYREALVLFSINHLFYIQWYCKWSINRFRVQFSTTDAMFQWHSVLCAVLLAISAETKKEKVLEKLFLFKSIWFSLECSTNMVAYSLHCTIEARIQIYIENNYSYSSGIKALMFLKQQFVCLFSTLLFWVVLTGNTQYLLRYFSNMW